jgi:outer membrane biogenesis lipoprotein LolB
MALLLAACMSAPPPRALPELAAVPASFELSGRLAVRQGDRSDIARLRWTHRPSGDLWVVSSPLGNEVARIESDGRGARLAQAGGPPREAASFADLTQALVGVRLEPAAMAGWIHGAGDSALPGDWKVTIEERQPAGSIEIARRISATRGDAVVRLVVDDYRALED